MDSAERENSNGLGSSQVVVQQYARYPSTLESALQSASSLGSARSQGGAQKSPSMHRRETPRSLQSSPRGVRSALPPSAIGSGPSMSPPLFDVMRQHEMKDTPDQVESRELPSRNVTDDTIDDAYVSFILYCNPNVPSSVDTSELRRVFRCPPRSDGKSYSVFTLFGLIQKLQSKQLKTWIQLAIELGVEPPSLEKKQSTQKVHQYAVRLKRWMRAMHVDAFFEYCMGNEHVYYTQLPSAGSFVDESRDGVALEDDLALRALVPQWKPKRGRKRFEETELGEGKVAKRPQLDTSVRTLNQGNSQDHSVVFPQSAIPFSAYPDTDGHDPWATASSAFPAASASTPQAENSSWRFSQRDTSPANYPQSAIIPRGNRSSDALMSAEPRSAVTPVSDEKGRSRRKHGPTVSSAWLATNNSTTGKGRGRPPNKPSSGSFSIFQVNTNQDSPRVEPTPADQSSSPAVIPGHPHINSSTYSHSPTPPTNGRPSKLQLQVPQHSGAPVRLATPPTLLVNGVKSAAIARSEEFQQPHSSGNADAVHPPSIPTGSPSSSLEDLISTLANELIRAPLTGRATSLDTTEAQTLAAAIITDLSKAYSHLPSGLPILFMAFHLGLGHHLGLTTSGDAAINVNIASSLIDSTTSDDPAHDDHQRGTRYTITFDYMTVGRFSMQLMMKSPNEGAKVVAPTKHTAESSSIEPEDNEKADIADFDMDDDGLDHPNSEASWKQRYLKLRSQMQKRDRALSQYKRKIMDSVMADI